MPLKTCVTMQSSHRHHHHHHSRSLSCKKAQREGKLLLDTFRHRSSNDTDFVIDSSRPCSRSKAKMRFGFTQVSRIRSVVELMPKTPRVSQNFMIVGSSKRCDKPRLVCYSKVWCHCFVLFWLVSIVCPVYSSQFTPSILVVNLSAQGDSFSSSRSLKTICLMSSSMRS